MATGQNTEGRGCVLARVNWPVCQAAGFYFHLVKFSILENVSLTPHSGDVPSGGENGDFA